MPFNPQQQHTYNTIWLALFTTGQWCLFGLLLTFIFIKGIPQGRNPYLFNTILTTFLSTIPPLLLLYTGYQSDMNPPHLLCFIQAGMVDGVAPMFTVAQVALLFDTWSEIRSSCYSKRRLSRINVVLYILTLVPYFTIWIWVFASFIAASQSHAEHVFWFAYCMNSSGPSNAVRKYIGIFVTILVITQLIFCSWIGVMLFRNRKELRNNAATWKFQTNFSLRLTIISCLQLLALLLSLINAAGLNSSNVKSAYDMLDSMNPLAIFLLLGTQKSILQAWKNILTGKGISKRESRLLEEGTHNTHEDVIQHHDEPEKRSQDQPLIQV